MGAGEYLATKSQDEVFESEVDLEKVHIEHFRRQEVEQLYPMVRELGVHEDDIEPTVAALSRNDRRAAEHDESARVRDGRDRATRADQGHGDVRWSLPRRLGSLGHALSLFGFGTSSAVRCAVALAGAALFGVGMVARPGSPKQTPFAPGSENLLIAGLGAESSPISVGRLSRRSLLSPDAKSCLQLLAACCSMHFMSASKRVPVPEVAPEGLTGHVGEFIRLQRERADLSLRRLADRAGVSNPYLSQIERGLRKPSAEILKRLSRRSFHFGRESLLPSRIDRRRTAAAGGNRCHRCGPGPKPKPETSSGRFVPHPHIQRRYQMKAPKALYAAVGAPVVGARMVGEQVEEIRTRLGKEATSFSKTATKRFNTWAVEGEKLLNKLTDAKVVDDIASRVDFDQVSTQVNKLRDQLEDLLATWRTSFRPEKLPAVKVEASTDGVKFQTIPAKKSPSRSTAKKTVTVKKAPGSTGKKAQPAKKTAAKKTVTVKKAPSKRTPARRPAAKKVAAKAS